jgi:hypothetical protein
MSNTTICLGVICPTVSPYQRFLLLLCSFSVGQGNFHCFIRLPKTWRLSDSSSLLRIHYYLVSLHRLTFVNCSFRFLNRVSALK